MKMRNVAFFNLYQLKQIIASNVQFYISTTDGDRETKALIRFTKTRRSSPDEVNVT